MKYGLTSRGIVVVGGQWGDEGKGRIVDLVANDCDVVVRFQGGNNAGHSLHIGRESLVLHLIPCGIMRAGKVCMIGNGVVIDPEVLFDEIELLKNHNIHCTPNNLKISTRAHIIFLFHKLIDAQRESRVECQIGTTKRGIGPCYEDKVARFGIVAEDLLSTNILTKKLEALFVNRNLSAFSELSKEKLFSWARAIGDRLAPYLVDVGELLHEELRTGKRVLFEGAQGALLDVDHGTYPYVTSSNCVAAQAAIGSGVGSHWLNDVMMVSKAYCTRVGEGPFFSEGTEEEQEHFRRLGNEFGATTGRPRRCGWLDLTALKYAARINGANGLVLTKVDILAGLARPIKVGIAYKSGLRSVSFTEAMTAHSEGKTIETVYRTFDPVGPMPRTVNKFADFPSTLRDIVHFVEDFVDLPIRMISYGRERGQELILDAE